ncbi:MAG TPA: helix-turn-helix domain-containing GNAT family N-acetyltransferase [Egibacteraceae bacterium]|nr:helix-turn-helix domain-containing GNAT family N-acetyltransferase [Egibacteraceae bacterium]
MSAVRENPVAAVRAFNRFYTDVIGVLRDGLLATPYSLTEARVIFELAQREATEVADLRRMLDIDAGYLSRILTRLEAEHLATRQRSPADARRQVVSLSDQGRAAFATLDKRSAEQIGELLATLPAEDQARLIAAMGTIRELLEGSPRRDGYVLRPLRAGDLGWVVHRHGVTYAEEFGWDERFEALVARIVAGYGDQHDPERETAWIAEVHGEPAGSVFCMRKDERTAQLRLLLVEPGARGLGIGSRLVAECIDFARGAGYQQLTLWTNDVLDSARRIYERAGFQLVGEEPHHSFGQDLVGQYWSRAL